VSTFAGTAELSKRGSNLRRQQMRKIFLFEDAVFKAPQYLNTAA